MDPLSITASTIAFLGAASKIKRSLDQVGANKKKLRKLSQRVITAINELEDLLLTDCEGIAPANAIKLRVLLEDLRSELDRAYSRCQKYLDRKRRFPLSGASSNVVAWFQSGDIDEMIADLEKQVHSSYLRCLVLITGNIHVVVSRAEEHLVLHRAEHRENMERLENAFSQMIMDTDQRNLPPISIVGASGVSKVDFAYLLRLVGKINDAYSYRKPTGSTICEEPHGHHLKMSSWPSLPWGQNTDMIFNQCMKEACCALNGLSSTSNQVFVQDYARSLLFLGDHLESLGLYKDAANVMKMAVTLYSMLSAGHPSLHFKRYLASALELQSYNSRFYPGNLSISERAVNICQSIYEDSGNSADMGLLVYALRSHCSHLLTNGSLEESLDCSKQTLVLTRQYTLSTENSTWDVPYPMVRWTGSGEVDVVFSSAREFYRSSHMAIAVATSLWRLASSLAALGRFAEARIAGMDALNCVQEILVADPWWADSRGMNADPWRRDVAGWVSLTRRPSLTGSTIAIEEVDESAGACDMAEKQVEVESVPVLTI